MNAQCRKVSRDGESSKTSKRTRKSPGSVDMRGKGIRKAQLQQNRFRVLREDELQGPPSRTRASLKRRLHEPYSIKLQVEKKPNQEDSSRNGDQAHVVEHQDNLGTDVCAPDAEPSGAASITQPLPEKHILALIIDTLQRKDVYEIFAEPVDPEEVKDYYEIIKEPMDFGTMRAKLHEGMYTSLEQFERDVFLISGNAMHFNSSGTIFFRQAHGIHKLAKRVFHVLRTNPENFESEFSGTRRRSCRRSHDDSNLLKTSETTSTATILKTTLVLYIHRITVDQFVCSLTFEVNEGAQDGKTCGSVESDRRSTYKPHLNINNESRSRFLVHLNQHDHNYCQSLMNFVKDLGPTAQMVAKRKIQSLSGAGLTGPCPVLRANPFPEASVSHQIRCQIPFGPTWCGVQNPLIGSIATPSSQNQIIWDNGESSRNGLVTRGHITLPESVKTTLMPGWPPRGPFGSSRFALDLGFLRSKMNGGGGGEYGMVRRNNKDSSFTQQLHVGETSYKPFDPKDLSLQL